MARSWVPDVRCRRGLQLAVILIGLVSVIIPVSMMSSDAKAAASTSAPVVQSTAFGLETFAQAPFKRSPFKRAPFKRAPFKRAPFKRAEARSPFVEQLVPTNVQRAGALRSATAAIDGIDEPLDVDIAVLDGGVDATHPDLRVVGSVNCASAGLNRDVDGHGTMVAGLAAARDNGIGVVGVAPGARIWSVRVARPDGTITEQAARCGLQWLVEHADTIEVANLSWSGAGDPSDACGTSPAVEATRARGGGGGANVDPGAEPELHALACAAHDAGVVLVAAAGNDAADAAGVLPAAWGEVIAVSALADSDGERGGLGGSPCDTGELDDHLASFSNTGVPVAIAAGGVCVASTDARGGYATGSGTSFAAPIVAGAAALLLVREPMLTPHQVREHLLATAEPGPISGDRDQTAEGVVDVGSD